MFGSVLWRALMSVERGNCIHRQWGRRLQWNRWRRLRPSMSSEDTVDILLTGELDGVRVLRNVKSIEVIDEPEVLEWGGGVFRWQL